MGKTVKTYLIDRDPEGTQYEEVECTEKKN